MKTIIKRFFGLIALMLNLGVMLDYKGGFHFRLYGAGSSALTDFHFVFFSSILC